MINGGVFKFLRVYFCEKPFEIPWSEAKCLGGCQGGDAFIENVRKQSRNVIGCSQKPSWLFVIGFSFCG